MITFKQSLVTLILLFVLFTGCKTSTQNVNLLSPPSDSPKEWGDWNKNSLLDNTVWDRPNFIDMTSERCKQFNMPAIPSIPDDCPGCHP